MYPNPQDVLPLPPRPSVEHYRNRAKDLVTACRSADAAALTTWILAWLESLATHDASVDAAQYARRRAHYGTQIAEYAAAQLRASDSRRALTKAQFVIARAHGFRSWTRFAEHLNELRRTQSDIARFDRAADAIVTGDLPTLTELFQSNPALIRARSSRDHGATLLHYVAANGVENYRQRTPPNAVAIARLLLDAGAEVDAPADMYGGGATTIGLVATSVHPLRAGVQNDLIDLLLQRGAHLGRNAVSDCLANGCVEAARHLAARGASVDLEGAAGIGAAERVRALLNDGSHRAQMQAAYSKACWYGHAEVVAMLLDHLDVRAPLKEFGNGHTGLHLATYNAHPAVVRLLLDRGADANAIDDTWNTTPLVWALHAWSQEEHRGVPEERYHQTVSLLVQGGARVSQDVLSDERVRRAPEMRAALGVKT